MRKKSHEKCFFFNFFYQTLYNGIEITQLRVA